MTTATKKKPSVNGQHKADYAQQATGKLWGELVTWELTSKAVKHTEVIGQLKAAGLDEKKARELAPRNAWSRACRKLGDERIINMLDDEGETLVFQFNRVERKGKTLDFPIETEVRVDKKTGAVSCPIADLQRHAQELLDKAMEDRTTGDITTLTKRIFGEHGDLWSVRQGGGVYMVPQKHADLINKVEQFLLGLGGYMNRIPIPAGTAHGDTTVQRIAVHGLESEMNDYAKRIEDFGENTRDSTVERQAADIKALRFKLECYSEYLGESRAKLDAKRLELDKKLKAKVAEIAAANQELGEVACDHCGANQDVIYGQATVVCSKCKKTSQIDW